GVRRRVSGSGTRRLAKGHDQRLVGGVELAIIYKGALDRGRSLTSLNRQRARTDAADIRAAGGGPSFSGFVERSDRAVHVEWHRGCSLFLICWSLDRGRIHRQP